MYNKAPMYLMVATMTDAPKCLQMRSANERVTHFCAPSTKCGRSGTKDIEMNGGGGSFGV